MERDRYLHRIFSVVVVFVVGYYLANSFFPAARSPESEKEKSPLLDVKTGQPIPEEEIAQITERQEKDRITYVLAGKVVEKSKDFVKIEIPESAQAGKWLLRLTFAPNMVFLKETKLPGFEKDSSATEEKEISLTEVSSGDIVSVVFSKGVRVNELRKTGVVQIGNLTVSLPRNSVSGEE